MARILFVLSLALVIGAALARSTELLPLRPGLVGLTLMLASAWLARCHWQRQSPARATGSPERSLWHGLASHGVLGGHLFAAVWMLAPAFEMHGRLGHAIAIDSWTLILGALISYGIARDPQPRRDERDALIAAEGWRRAHAALVLLLSGLILALAFGGSTSMAQVSQPMLAHLLILALLVHVLVQYVVRLGLYAIDAQAEAAAEAAGP